MIIGCVGLVCFAVVVAADPPYVGRWKVNEEKSDRGTAFTFATEAGALRLTQGDRSYIVRFDGKEYPHPLGGLVRWSRIDDRSWETAYTENGKLLGNAIYRLSDDGQTLTVRQKSGSGAPAVYHGPVAVDTFALRGRQDTDSARRPQWTAVYDRPRAPMSG